MENKTFNGDCLEVMKDFSANSIDLLFCDLPYGETSCKWDCKIDLELFWKEINRICKINCPMFFTTTTRFGVELINSNPKNFRYDLVWVKSAGTGFLNAKKMPMRKHELIYVFYRKLPYYDLSSHKHKFLGHTNTNTNETKEEKCYGEGSHNYEYTGEAREANVYEPPLPVSVIKTEMYDGTTRTEPIYRAEAGLYDPPLPNSILEIKSEKGKHATQKPIELIKWILKYYSKEGDIILDPTMGSGSTLIACKQMNRKFIGIEKDEKIYKDAIERLSKN
jgi:site-specific DNA-methyltransferase (adenine-specific)